MAEIDDARKEGRCEGEVISYNDAAQLPYLQAALKEGLRIFAPISSESSNPQKGHCAYADMFVSGLTASCAPGGS